MAGIVTKTDGGLGIVTLDDPAGGNRLNSAVLSALLEAMETFAVDPAVRAILLRSRGRAFCHGMDLAGLVAAGAGSRREGLEQAVGTYVRVLTLMQEAPKPVIALVNGSVKAGGVGIASACDVVVASEDSSFELGEAFFGIIPANVLPFLLGPRISLQKARYLVLTARSLGGREAELCGLVDELYPSSELERGLRELLKRLWRTSPRAAAEAKAFTSAIARMDPVAARERAREKLTELLGREEVIAAIAAFVDGSVPPWFAKWKPSAPLVLTDDAAAPGGAA